MKHAGIWLDKEKAYVVPLYNDQTSINTVFSDVENFHIIKPSVKK